MKAICNARKSQRSPKKDVPASPILIQVMSERKIKPPPVFFLRIVAKKKTLEPR